MFNLIPGFRINRFEKNLFKRAFGVTAIFVDVAGFTAAT